MELRHLRYFLTVAEEGQFTRAAERLAMQQPPLSQQIRSLEEEIGFELFIRMPRGVTLTPAGHAFAEDAQQLLQNLQASVEKASRIARGELGTLSIGLTSSAAFHPFTTEAIRAFRAVCPEVSVELAELNAAEIIERLAAGQIQAAFLRKPVDVREGVAFELLLDEPMVVVLPLGHPLLKGDGKAARKRPQVSLKALAHEDFILVRRPGAPGMYADILAACRQAGFVPRVAREVPRMVSGINLVAAGMGVTLVPASMQRYDHVGTVYCTLTHPSGLSAPLHLAYPEALHNSAAMRFIQLVKERVSG
ncbi:LysR family transcriptional regulator [Paraburkholderia metrosideri]|jgi:DNA-binding transcriptional LysR family regulator|uniref:HTH-type transcriptional regulator BenM n=1 Tax=Paraburkholderia metrosideri TaxID=580937 RepID=A0ABM8P070_9BURK|nr:LysR family transcriptional regulator [Paraburkholderia metrosideri]CAD6551862.1 HTH-type transcriptional regulator BenM [Paraburkholderia metrosideri]